MDMREMIVDLNNAIGELQKRYPLDEQQILTQIFAYIWIFESVAGADGNVEEKEIELFNQFLSELTTSGSELTKKLTSILVDNKTIVYKQYEHDSEFGNRTHGQGIKQTGEILRKMKDEEIATNCAEDYYDLAMKIAGATSVGDKEIDDGEENCLIGIARCMSVSPKSIDLEELNTSKFPKALSGIIKKIYQYAA